MTGRRILTLAVVTSLCATAAIAIGVLLFSEFHRTQGRILGTTALIALYGLLALPAGILFDQRRFERIARATVVLAVADFALALAGLWSNDAPPALGKAIGTVGAFALAAAQTAGLASRRSPHDTRTVRRLFAASLTLALIAASMVATAAWAEISAGLFFRVLGALAVADVLTVALQPILARTAAAPTTAVHHLRLVVDTGAERDLQIEAPSFATAVERAIAVVEDEGETVERIERVPPWSTSGRPRS